MPRPTEWHLDPEPDTWSELSHMSDSETRTAAHTPEPEHQPRDPADAKHANTHKEHV